jgi:hypothetical protein
MKLRHSVPSTALLLAALIASCTPTLSGQSNKQDAKFDAVFTEGTKALDEQRWNDALKSFDKASQYNSARTDAAFYWKAYTLAKLNRAQEAAATCEILRTRFADSTWNKDCTSLMINTNINVQVNAALAKSLAGPHPMPMPNPPFDMQFNFDNKGDDPEADIKILALNSLMKQNPAQAIPMIRGVLSGSGSIQMKRHALFILARDKSPEAKALLEDVARGKMGPELQREGIRSLVVSQGTKSNDTLLDIYKTSTDVKIKESVISAIATTQDAPRLVDMARNEKDLKLKRDIVTYLASMHDKVAQDYMLELLK